MIELVAIGDELLSGISVNSNAAFISKELLNLGMSVSRHTTLPDDPRAMKQGFQEALARSSLVISTGGLGPTCDDLTRPVAAELFHSPFHYDEAIARELKKRYGEHVHNLQDQATVPTKALVLINQVGTAPGLIFHAEGKTLILLPGVPQEMRPMFLEQVVPYLRKHIPLEKPQVQEIMHLCLLPEGKVDPLLREFREEYPHVASGIYPAYATLSVRFTANRQADIAPLKKRIEEAFGTYLYAAPSGKIEEAVHLFLQKEGLTLALAESCTGGMIAEQLTALSGASDYLLGSLVVYSNEWKKTFLGVSSETLQHKGAVSREAVSEMLEGLFAKTSADYAIAVTGIAGPSGGSAEKPVGTVWAALGKRGEEPDVWTFRAKGNRETILLSTSHRLLAALWRKLAFGIRGGT